MKTLTFLLAFLSITTFAQDSLWVEYTMPYDSGIVNNLFYVDTTTAWAVGRNAETGKAVIMHTNDGFDSWTIQDESLNGNLNGIFMKNPQSGFAVGQSWNNGHIAMLKTENGTTWSNQTLPTIFGSLNDVVFTADMKSFAVGVNLDNNPSTPLIIYTEDGATWQEATYPKIDNIFLSEVTFPSEDEGWCVGSSMGDIDSTFILYSGDGGLNWQKINHPIQIGAIEGMNFISPDSAIFYGQAADTAFMMLTPDKGQSWEFISVNEDEPDQVPLKSISALNETCKESVVGVFISYVDFEFFPYIITIYGWRVVAYKNCPTGKRYELQRVALIWAADGSYKLIVLEKTDFPEMIVTKGIQIPPANNGNNGQQPLNGPIVFCGTNTINSSPIIIKKNPYFQSYIIEGDRGNILRIELTNTNSAIVCLNEDNEITVNGISTGVKNNSVIKVTVTGTVHNYTYINASCITNENRGTIAEVDISSGTGKGPHNLIAPKASEITTNLKGQSGHTDASGGDGIGVIYVGDSNNGTEPASVTSMDPMGNESYRNNRFSVTNDVSIKKGIIKNKLEDLPTNSYTDDSGNDTLIYSNFGWPVNIDLDLNGIAQQISSDQMLELNGQFENFIGSTFDDKITAKPLVDEPRFIDGGDHDIADTLFFDALGLEVVNDGSSLNVEGYLPVNYINIENLIIINTPGPLFRIEITPEDTIIEIGEQVQFTAKGFDEQGLTVSINPEWTTTGGTITTEGLFTAGTVSGDFQITASVDEITNNADVTVLSDNLFQIEISPSFVELETGSQQQFSATGFDQHDNEITIIPEWTATGGTITTEGLFTAGTVSGDFQITASVDEITNNADVTILCDTLFQIEISPSSVEMETGSQQQFSATGFDQYNNEITIVPEWTTTGGTISDEGLFIAGDTEGTFYVYASSGKIVGEASVIINIPTNVSIIEAQDNKILLFQNYPNPFTKSTNIKYIIPAGAEFENGIHVLLNVYDFSGQKVKTLVNKKQQPDSFLIEFNSSSIKQQLPAGIYHYRLNIDGRYSVSKKMMLK